MLFAKALSFVSLISSFLLIAGTGFGVSGCTSVSVNLPEPIVETPEVVGATGRPALGLGYFNTHKVTAVNNGSSRPPVMRSEDESGNGDVSINGDIGVFRRFQVGVRLGPISPMGLIETKFQILGSPILSSAEEGEVIPEKESQSDRILLAIFGRLGAGSRSEHGDQKDVFGPGGFPWTATAQLGVLGAGFSVGYRVLPDLSIFSGGAFDRYHVHAAVSQDPSTDGSSQGGQYSQDYDGSASTVALGFTWGRQVSMTGYAAATRLDWPNVGATPNLHVGLDLKLVLN